MVFISLERSTDWDFHPIKESHTHTRTRMDHYMIRQELNPVNMQKDRKQIY